jgi:hypothetical protein
MTTPFRIGCFYSRNEISSVLGGGTVWYIPTVNKKVVAVCVRKDLNPRAPEIVYCGRGILIESTGKILASETAPVRVFVKHEINAWRYEGKFKVSSSHTSGARFQQLTRTHRDPSSISRVVVLKKIRS